MAQTGAPARSGKRRIFSYGLAAAGSIASAGAQFLLSFQLLHAVDPGQFGGFAFLLLCSQLSLGVSGALLCAPYPVLLQKHALDPKPIVTALFSANLALAIGTG
ncbi:MAG: hypothetical protein JWR39_1190, partial [Devosia sp.]|nr:hypothetical protein [Devosia sp.]